MNQKSKPEKLDQSKKESRARLKDKSNQIRQKSTTSKLKKNKYNRLDKTFRLKVPLKKKSFV